MNTNNKEENTQAAQSTKLESSELKNESVESEEALVSKRRGRLGAAHATRGLTKRNSEAHSTNQTAVYRVVITRESNEALESVFDRCVGGFDSGTITKSDVANYIFQNINKFFTDNDVKNLRAAHFNEKKVLGSILRTDADLPEELKKAIRAHYGIAGEKEKKRPNKQIGTS